MPKAPVDSKGAELFFTDSGAPSSSNYTTLVVFHGSGFNGSKELRGDCHMRLRLIICGREFR